MLSGINVKLELWRDVLKLKGFKISWTLAAYMEVVISWGWVKDCQSWRMWSLVYEILDIASELECSFSHVPREQNSLADSLANWGVAHQVHYNDCCLSF